MSPALKVDLYLCADLSAPPLFYAPCVAALYLEETVRFVCFVCDG